MRVLLRGGRREALLFACPLDCAVIETPPEVRVERWFCPRLGGAEGGEPRGGVASAVDMTKSSPSKAEARVKMIQRTSYV